MSPASVRGKGADGEVRFRGSGGEWILRPSGPSPCRVSCPAGVDAKAYVSLIAAGKYAEALKAVKRKNPFPGICGRVCTHPCEKECSRGVIDEPVAICALKRFVADWEVRNAPRTPAARKQRPEKAVAVVGSGPAGLTAAADLASEGVGVTVFERLGKPGGTMITGIPAYRLPRDVIEREIGAIEDLGVEIKTGVEIGSEGFGVSDLLASGFKAVFIATGAWRSLKLGVPGEELEGVLDCSAFLRKVNLEGGARLRGRVVVVGGGNSAVDAARCALRSGASEVAIVYRRTRSEMPAAAEEIEEALEEGVRLEILAAPVKAAGEGGRLSAIECVRMRLGEPDQSGRRRPVPIDGSEFAMKADFLIPAIGMEPDASFMGKTQPKGLALERDNTVRTDRETCSTGNPAVFAGGDAATGPATVIDAIEAGHRAARSILKLLGKADAARLRFDLPAERELVPDAACRAAKKRRRPAMANPKKRTAGFEEAMSVLSEPEARAEAARCLRCGACADCAECVHECTKRLAVMTGTRDGGRSEGIIRVEMRDGTCFAGAESGRIEAPDGSWDAGIELLLACADAGLCRSCGECAKACPYSAARIEGGSAKVDPARCKGCGICAGACPTGAMSMKGFSDADFIGRLRFPAARGA